MKIAYLFYYQGKVESGATGHLEPKHVEPCVKSLLSNFDRIIIRDDGSRSPLPKAIVNKKVIYLRVEPNQGIQTGYRWAATDCLPQDIAMLVDPHNIYNEKLLQEQLKMFDDDVKLQVLFQDVTAFRVRQGDWAAWRSEMDGPIGAEDGLWSVILRGSALKRYKAEWSDKLSPEDQSYPMPHLITWCDKFLSKEEHRIAKGPMIGDVNRHVHDDTLDLWGQLRSCYSNGYKVGSITAGGVSSQRQQMYELLRAPLLYQAWATVEEQMNILGMAAAKFQIDESRSYWDVYWSSEDVDYRFLAERPYYLTAANYVVGNVLDVGCGNGAFLNLLWNQRPHYHFDLEDHISGLLEKGQQLWYPFADGIDTSKVAIEKAKAYRKYNPNRVITFNVQDFFELEESMEDAYDTVLMLDFLPYIPWEMRRMTIEAAMQITRHRVIATLPAMPLQPPNILKDEDGFRYYTREKLITLFEGFPEPLFYDVAEMTNQQVAKWIIVATKRPIKDDWEPRYGVRKRLEEVTGTQEMGGRADAV
jgi:SAM-dependent methyltransferase